MVEILVPVAQLDRASDCGSEGQRFKSSRGYHFTVMHKILKSKNGIRIVLVPKEDSEVVTIACGFGVGSRHEKESEQGISHLLEHLIYDGAKRRKTAKEVSEYIDSLGAEHNAFTSKEYTGYYVKLNSKDLEHGLDFWSDNIVNANLSENDIKKEKKVIFEEIDMHEDIPLNKVMDTIDLAAYSGHSLAKEISGKKDIIKKIDRKKILDFKNRYYSKDNFVVVVAGKIDKPESWISSKVDSYFLGLRDESNKSDGYCVDSDSILAYPKKIEQTNFILAFKAPSDNDDDKYAVNVLTKIFSGSMSSRLFSRIREDLGLVYAVEGFLSTNSDCGTIQIYAGLDSKNLNLSIKEIKKEVDGLVERGITSKELKKAKKMITTKLIIKSESSSSLAVDYLTSILVCNKIETPEEKIRKYNTITLEDVNRAAKKYLSGRIYASLVGPGINTKKTNKLISKYWKE